MTKYVYSFGNGTADGDGKMKDVLGGKGAGLAEMCRAKLPVPPGFTISTQVCNIYFQSNNTVPREIHEQMLDAMKTYGPDSLTGQLSCLFQGAAETTFYVIALYFGSVSIKETRYTLSVMLLVDLVCVLTAIVVCSMYF